MQQGYNYIQNLSLHAFQNTIYVCQLAMYTQWPSEYWSCWLLAARFGILLTLMMLLLGSCAPSRCKVGKMNSATNSAFKLLSPLLLPWLPWWRNQSGNCAPHNLILASLLLTMLPSQCFWQCFLHILHKFWFTQWCTILPVKKWAWFATPCLQVVADNGQRLSPVLPIITPVALFSWSVFQHFSSKK